jgi:hypothetical protein
VWHVDGAEVYRASEYIVYSWASALAVGDIQDVKMLFCAFPYARVPGALQKRAHRALSKLIGWSMEWAEKGLWPERDHEGQAFPTNSVRARLAGRTISLKAAYWGFKADLKAAKEVHELRQWYGCRYLCSMCLAVRPLPKTTPEELLFNFKDFGEGALLDLEQLPMDSSFRRQSFSL